MLEAGGMCDDVGLVSAGSCCPGGKAGWVWPGISIVSLTLQGVSQTLAHFPGPITDIVYSRTPFRHNTQLTTRAAKYSKLTLGDKFAKLIFTKVAQLCLVTCFEEFNLKFNQAAEHDRKNCLNSQHHQILW